MPTMTYPPVLILSADHDDRVVPSHAKKFAAALQAATSGDKPVLLRLEQHAGHGFGMSVQKVITMWSDGLAFLVRQFDMADAFR